jgi:hypothetical protein
VLVDAALNPDGSSLTVVANSAEAAAAGTYAGSHPVGSALPVRRAPDGAAYVELRAVGASEVLLLTSRP